MKQKKDKTESIVFSNDESTEILFEKIKNWEIASQVEFTVSFENPKRKELFEKIFEAVTNETLKQNIFLIIQRIEQAAFHVSGYTTSEIEHYQSLFAKDFYTVLHSEKYQTFIEDKIRELHFFCKGLELDLRKKQYEFLEDREQDKNELTEVERYKFYLESFIIHLKNPSPQQTETETEQGIPTFTNNFDNNKTTEIYKHFKAGLVEKGYLTEQELNEYLKAAFELKTKPETLFKLKHTPTKQKIYTVFYIYYKDISQKKHERQKEYAALLGDFFEGYKTEIIQTNWARDYKTKR